MRRKKKIMNEIQLKPIVNHLQKNKEDIDSIRNLFEDKEINKKLFNIKLDMVDVISCIKRKYIAWLGIFQYQKNLPALLRIVKLNPHLKFQIAGKHSINCDRETESILKILEQQKNVKLIGYKRRDQVHMFLSESYALLNTSHYEGFSNTFLESFASGTPVISLMANPDNILTKYKLGFVINENQVGKICDKLIKDESFYREFELKVKKYLTQNHNYLNLSSILVSKLADS